MKYNLDHHVVSFKFIIIKDISAVSINIQYIVKSKIYASFKVFVK